MKKLVFCYNQVSYVLACELARRDKHIRHKIFYSPSRVSTRAADSSLNVVAYSTFKMLMLLLWAIFSKPDEVILPHFKCGRLIELIAKLPKKLSLIDDGLDSFREKPKNLNPSFFVKDTKYYTFNYKIGLAKWLDNFDLDKVCDLDALAQDDRPKIELGGVQYLIIESPGLAPSVLAGLNGNALIVKHPSGVKNVFSKSEIPFVQGREIAVERSLAGFGGELLVGESMVMVYAILTKQGDGLVAIHLERKVFENLCAIQPILLTPNRVKLVLH